MYQIYLITNAVNGKKYVGQTRRTLAKRWSGHVTSSRSGKEIYFYNAIRKHGEQSFTIEQIATCETREWANHLEKMWILLLDTTNSKIGYNGTRGGDGGALVGEALERMRMKVTEVWNTPEMKQRASENRKGKFVGPLNPMWGRTDTGQPHTEETKELLSQQAKKRFEDPEYKARMSEANTGKHHTEEGKKNIAAALVGNQYRKGIPHSDEIKKQISDSLKRTFERKRELRELEEIFA